LQLQEIVANTRKHRKIVTITSNEINHKKVTIMRKRHN